MKIGTLAFAAILLPSAAFCEDQQFKNAEPVSIAPDKAYLLARTYEIHGKGLQGAVKIAPILIRVLSDEELAQAGALAKGDPEHWREKVPSNIVEMLPREPYSQSNGEEVLLTAVQPGTYVLGGVAGVSWILKDIGAMTASLCMGTVTFEAKKGVITDLGAILAAYDDEPTTIPELTKIVTGKSARVNSGFGYFPFEVAVRPPSSAMVVPASLIDLPRLPAKYRAVSAFPNYSGAPISRLAPLAGVLDYNKDGDVVDPMNSNGEAH